MRKKIGVFFATCLILIGSVAAQTVATAIVEYNGLKYPAYVKDLEVGPEQVSKAVSEYFTGRGARAKEHRGYTIYRNVMLPNSSASELQDVLIRVERAGKKGEEKSKLIAIITKPGTISEDKPSKEQKSVGSGVVLAPGGVQFFEALNPGIATQAYLKDLADQEAIIQKAEKKLKDLENDKSKLEKQLDRIKSELENTTKAIEEQAAELNKAKGVLENKKATTPQ